MKDLLPELLLDIFDLVVHTPSHNNRLFPDRSEAIDAHTRSVFRFVKNDRFPDFQTGIASHSTNPHTPLDLSHVCQQWRNMVFAESQLWSTIYVTNGPPGHVPLFSLWLKNSGSRPIKLVFRDGRGPHEKHGDVIAQMLLLAAVHHDRWASLKIKLRHILLPMPLVAQAVSTAELPILRTLAFSFNMTTLDGDPYHDFNHVWGNIANHSPQLREMQMWSAMDYEPSFLDRIPLHQLTSLILPMVEIEGESYFLESLRRCVCLDTLSISIRSYCEPQPWDPYTLAIPSLRKLYIHADTTESLNNLLGAIHLPSLTHLSIHTNSLRRVHPMLAGYAGALEAFGGQTDNDVSRQPIKLEEALDNWKPQLLSLQFRDEEAQKFQDFFLPLVRHVALETLEDLRVGGIAGVEFIQALTKDLDTPTSSLVPNLKTIHIESAFFDDSHPGAITRMVQSRLAIHNSNHLCAVHVDFLSKDELAEEIGQWERVKDRRFQQVEKSFNWIGMGERVLEREFMLEDFSMIQNW